MSAEDTAPPLEHVSVVANRQVTPLKVTPVSSFAVVNTQNPLVPQNALPDLLSEVAGVSFAGQGGLLQVVSVRGISRGRVQHRIEDILVNTERRAGSASSFLDPKLLARVDVIKGPSSTYYGSGAIGGVISLAPADFDAPTMTVSWEGNHDASRLFYGWGDDQWSMGASVQDGNDGEDARGDPLNDSYRQYSGLISHKSTLSNGMTSQWFLTPSLAEDIGKSSADFPDQRVTDYPEELHLPVQWRLSSDEGWSASLWLHHSELKTLVKQVDSADQDNSKVLNESTDWGSSLVRDWSYSQLQGRLGIDLTARSNVTATETQTDALGMQTQFGTLDGDQADWGIFADAFHESESFTWTAGGRASYVAQENSGESESASAFTGFVGGAYHASDFLDIRTSVGTGFRFPSLTERYYQGTTGRGTTIGNPDLDPESSYQAEIALDFQSEQLDLTVQVYQMVLRDYIERISVGEGIRSYENIRRAEIYGADFTAQGQLGDHTHWLVSGQFNDGEDADNETLADLSASELLTRWRYRADALTLGLTYQFRVGTDDVAATEQAIHDAHLLSLSAAWQLTPEWSVSLWGKNLLDEYYLVSKDDKSPFALGARAGVSISYR